jgi:hypothetical protein
LQVPTVVNVDLHIRTVTERRAYLFGFGNGKKGVFPTERGDGRAGVPFSPSEGRFAVVGVSLNPDT